MMMGIPVIGWFIGALISASFAVPFWFVWTYLEIGRTYFFFLPVIYQSPPFWDCVGFYIAIIILKNILSPTINIHHHGIKPDDISLKLKTKEPIRVRYEGDYDE